MKKIAIGFMLAGLVVGCGSKKSEEPQTLLEKRLTKIDRKAAEWDQRKKDGRPDSYSIGYNREENSNPYYVNIDIRDGKAVCREKVPLEGKIITEKGDEINTHEWGKSFAYTIEQIHEECRKSVRKNPDAVFNYSWGGDLVWCDGNFGIDGPKKGVIHFGYPGRHCSNG